jgi:hypothetical protein
MFKARVPVPAGVEIERYFDVQQITNGDSEKSLFPPNPSGVSTDNNYSSNPFPENLNYVILGISIQCTLRAFSTAANIDPIKVLNLLSDATFVLSSNQGRTEDIVHRLKDYLNLNDVQVALTSAASDDAVTTTVTLPTTGVRQPDNLFFLKPNESFTVKTKFNSSDWPTTAHWTTAGIGRFGLEANLIVAKMTDEELYEYQQRVIAAGGKA